MAERRPRLGFTAESDDDRDAPMSCVTDWRRAEDPELHDDYAEGVLEPRWAGLLTLQEARYIATKLAESKSLRRAWGFRRRLKYPLTLIAERAYPENPKLARHHILSLMKTERARASKTPAVAQKPSGTKLKTSAAVSLPGMAQDDSHLVAAS